MKRICHAVVISALVLIVHAQESAAPKVLIPLIANGSYHQPTTITPESLVITDRNAAVTGARLLRGADLPPELGVLVDASSSQRGTHTRDTLKAAKEFVDQTIRRPEDRVFFLQFRDEADATQWLSREQLQGTTLSVTPVGATAFYDALVMACKQRMGPRDWRRPTRRILLVVSDGEDNSSRITRIAAEAEAIKSGVAIFTINTANPDAGLRGEKVLESFAKITGGESFSQIDSKDLPKEFSSLKGLLEGMYYLSYVPPDASKKELHDVEIKPAPNEGFQLTYAREYFWSP
jgi:Ca-activated chloride channel family protein